MGEIRISWKGKDDKDYYEHLYNCSDKTYFVLITKFAEFITAFADFKECEDSILKFRGI